MKKINDSFTKQGFTPLTLKSPHNSRLGNFFLGLLERLIRFPEVARIHRQSVELMNSDTNFWQAATKVMGINVDIKASDIGKIPSKGATIFVANHPFGGVEAIALASVISQVRNDFMFIANQTLNLIPEVAPYLFAVDIDESKGVSAKAQNRIQIQKGIQHLQSGGVLILFPSGEISTANPPWKKAYDRKWSSTAAKIAKASQARVVPVYFGGKNSFAFQVVSIFLIKNPKNFVTRSIRQISLFLRAMLMVHEIVRQQNQTLNMRVDSPIPYDKFSHIESNQALSEYFRLRTYLLGGDPQLVHSRLDILKRNPIKRTITSNKISSRKLAPIGPAIPKPLLQTEIENLVSHHPESLILETKQFSVYLTKKHLTPNIITEIGRLREITFREEGEGSGLSYDIDDFDSTYEHIFVWSRSDLEITGAYRLGTVRQLLANEGLRGIYTHSLFQYDQKFLDEIGESMELGRSFVVAKFQKSRTLSLLLTGIAKVLLKRPHIKTLFGPASISAEYSKIASFVMIEFLMRQHGAPEKVKAMVTPPFPFKINTDLNEASLSHLIKGAHDLNGLNSVIESVENGGKSVPTLVTYYSKIGARYVAFNVDPEFSSIDGLIVSNLSEFPAHSLKKMIGERDAEQFMKDRALHHPQRLSENTH